MTARNERMKSPPEYSRSLLPFRGWERAREVGFYFFWYISIFVYIYLGGVGHCFEWHSARPKMVMIIHVPFELKMPIH